MTSIPEMTNEQLDRLIAEARGSREDYKFYPKGSKVALGRGLRDGDAGIITIEDLWINSKGNCSVSDPLVIHPYSTDQRCAMELLKEMAEQHCFGGISFTKKWKLDYKACHNTYKSVFADTPERAIAEAWYQWKGEK